MNFFKKSSRDFSEAYEGRLEITIEGIGTRSFTFERDLLAFHIATVQCLLSNDVCIVSNIKNAPWTLVSFDREKKKLVVRPV